MSPKPKSVFFTMPTKENELSFNARLIWAYLASCDRWNQPATRRQIAEAVRLGNRLKAVTSAIKSLQALKLARHNDDGYLANEPPENLRHWWRPRAAKAPKHWTDYYAFIPVEFAEERAIESVVLALMLKLSGGAKGRFLTSAAGLATLLGCDPRTVTSAVCGLGKQGRITTAKENNSSRRFLVTFAPQAVVEEAQKRTEAPDQAIASEGQPIISPTHDLLFPPFPFMGKPKEEWSESQRSLFDVMEYANGRLRSCRYDNKVILECLRRFPFLCDTDRYTHFENLLEIANREHAANGKGGHSGNLLLYKLKRIENRHKESLAAIARSQ